MPQNNEHVTSVYIAKTQVSSTVSYTGFSNAKSDRDELVAKI